MDSTETSHSVGYRHGEAIGEVLRALFQYALVGFVAKQVLVSFQRKAPRR